MREYRGPNGERRLWFDDREIEGPMAALLMPSRPFTNLVRLILGVRPGLARSSSEPMLGLET